MLEIVYLRESLWKCFWAWCRFGVWFNHVGLCVDHNRFIHLGQKGVRISKVPRDSIPVFPSAFLDIDVDKEVEISDIIKDDYMFGEFREVKLDRLRLMLPFLPHQRENVMLCNEFIDDLILTYLGRSVDTLKLARKL